jgi:hypothetical protein
MSTEELKEVQVIDDELEYNTSFDKFVKQKDLVGRGLDYNVVAVIGC